MADSLQRLAASSDAAALRALDIQLIGTKTGLETRLFAEAGLPCHYLSARPLPARKGLRWCGALLSIARALAEAWLLLRRLRPDVVVGIGGYASVCVLRAAQSLGIPTHVHENDSHVGRSNQVLMRRATSISTGFAGVADSMGRSDAVVTGNPLRAEFASRDGARARARYGVEPGVPLVVVTGGSRGAVALNRAAIAAVLEVVADGAEVLLVTGRGNLAECEELAGELPEAARQGLHLVEYVADGMADLLSAADVAVSRSGALTVFELAACGTPALLVPYPYATQEHQRANAEICAASGAAEVIDQQEAVAPGVLAERLRALLADPGAREAMRRGASDFARPDASERIARMVLALAQPRGSKHDG